MNWTRQTEKSIPRRIFHLTFAMGLIAILTAIAVMTWMASRIDTVAQDKSIIMANNALLAEQERIATPTRDYGFWDAAFEWYEAADAEALFDNLGISATTEGTFDALYLVSPEGDPDFVYVYDQPTASIADYPADVGVTLQNALRALPLEPYSAVKHFAMHEGVLTIFVAARLQRTRPVGLAPEKLPMLIGALQIGPAALEQIGQNLLLDDMQVIAADAILPAGRSAAPVRDSTGGTVAQISWATQSPGATLIRQTAPVLILLAVITLAISLLIGRAAAQQTKIYLKERINARTDALTGLLNRSGLDELAKHPGVQEDIRNGELALIYADLNGFKKLNDTLGHAFGDEALRVTADRLRACVRQTDHVARLSGDEFLCLLRSENLKEKLPEIAARIKDVTGAAFHYSGRHHRAPAAIGVALGTETDDWNSLIMRADKAMYSAKQAEAEGDPQGALTA